MLLVDGDGQGVPTSSVTSGGHDRGESCSAVPWESPMFKPEQATVAGCVTSVACIHSYVARHYLGLLYGHAEVFQELVHSLHENARPKEWPAFGWAHAWLVLSFSIVGLWLPARRQSIVVQRSSLGMLVSRWPLSLCVWPVLLLQDAINNQNRWYVSSWLQPCAVAVLTLWIWPPSSFASASY